MPGKVLLQCLLGLIGLFVQPLAHADVWGFVDEKGVTHFSASQVDGRYTLFLRLPDGGGQPVTVGTRAAATATADSAAALPAGLAEFFATSLSYRAARPLLQEAAKSHRIDFELLQALVATESGFDANAISPKGAIGLMQVMPDTARRFGLGDDRWGAVERKLADPRINIRTGSRYLRLLLDRFPGRLDLVLASYNAGEGAVQKAGYAVPNFKETVAYVDTVTQIYRALKPSPVPVVTNTPSSANGMEPLGQAKGSGRLHAELGVSGLAFHAPAGQLTPGGALGRGNVVRTGSVEPVPAVITFERQPSAE